MILNSNRYLGILILISFLISTHNYAQTEDKLIIGSNRKIPHNNFNVTETSRAFSKVAKTVIPSVVSIYSTIVVKTKDIWKDQFNTDEINDFFSDQLSNLPLPREFRQRGSGSGIIVSNKGHILTNVHVIEKAEYIEVTLTDNRTFSAEIIGVDPLTEVAVIKINGTDLPVAALGNSDSCDIGEWVMAVGNPLDLSSTVTAGIISAKGRDINIIRDTYGVENFIQTDAVINPGNSGGPLVNIKGEVIGVTTAIATESGYNQGYGFAIPINLAKDIMEDLISKGRVVRGYLGISMQDIDEKKARALGLKKPMGVFIDSINEDGPAYKAGLKTKDVLLKVDDKIVNKANIVQSIIAEKNPHDLVPMAVYRNGVIVKLNVILGERQYAIMVPSVIKNNKDYQYLGMQVDSLSSNLAEDFGLKNNQGIIISAVERYSPAFEAGIVVDDIILELDNHSITDCKMYYSIIDSLSKGQVIIIKIRREDTTFHAFIEIPN